jgi:lipid-binding SYLF domain-containing protein
VTPFLPALALPAFGASPKKARKKIDKNSTDAVERLFKESPEAKDLFEEACGYATFAGTEAALLISSGGGRGVAIAKPTCKRIYLSVASAGVGLGLGIQAT